MVPLPAAAVRFSGHTIVDRSELSCCSAGPRRVGREQSGERLGEYSCRLSPLLRSVRLGARWGLASSWPSAGVSFLFASLPTRP